MSLSIVILLGACGQKHSDTYRRTTKIEEVWDIKKAPPVPPPAVNKKPEIKSSYKNKEADYLRKEAEKSLEKLENKARN